MDWVVRYRRTLVVIRHQWFPVAYKIVIQQSRHVWSVWTKQKRNVQPSRLSDRFGTYSSIQLHSDTSVYNSSIKHWIVCLHNSSERYSLHRIARTLPINNHTSYYIYCVRRRSVKTVIFKTYTCSSDKRTGTATLSIKSKSNCYQSSARFDSSNTDYFRLTQHRCTRAPKVRMVYVGLQPAWLLSKRRFRRRCDGAW